MRTWLYPTVAQAYVKESGNIRTEHSRISYLKVIRLLQTAFPHKGIEQLTAGDLTTFCLSRYDGKPGHAAPATQRNRRAHVRATFEWAQWKGFIKLNPAAELKFTVKPGRGGVRQGTWLTKAQVLEVLEASHTGDVQDERNRLIVLVGVLTGLRRFELAGLTWSSFNESCSQLSLKGKGDKLARLGVPSELQAELQAWRRKRQAGGVAVFPSMRWVMNPSKGRRQRVVNWDIPLGEAGISYAVTECGQRCGHKLDPHDLRRSFAQILESEGYPLKEIQGMMRHENIATTDKYLEKNPNRAIEAAQGLRLGL